MRAFFRWLARFASAPLLGAIRYALSFILLCIVWFYDARVLNNAFDLNLTCVKHIAGALDGSGRIEAALRGFSAEKMLLFTEASILVWLVGTILCWPFGLAFASRSSQKDTQRQAATPRPKTPPVTRKL